MPSYKRPGVYAEEILNPSSAVSAPSTGVGAFVAAHGRGPTVPTLVSSWTEFLNRFGGFGSQTQYLPYAVHQFFSNGGSFAYVWRAVGAGAVKATRTLLDVGGVNSALRIDALNEGTWGNSINVDVVLTGVDRFDLVVRFGGTTDGFVVERWADMSVTNTDSRYFPNVVNSPLSGSRYIAVTDLGIAAVPGPANRPAAQAATSLAAGADGAAPSATELSTSVALLDTVSGPLVLNLPGVFDTTVLTTTLAYAAARADVFVVVDAQVGRTAAQYVTYANSLASAYGACYGPWVYVADPSSNSPGATRLVPPGGAVVGNYLRTDATRGIHKAPAGTDARISGAIAVETRFTNTEQDTLTDGLVNVIRQLPGLGIVIFGARTLRSGYADKYVPTRRTLSYIRKAVQDGTRWAVFEPNDATLWQGINARITAFLIQLWQQGALRGGSVAEAFYVKCDGENNPLSSIQQGVVNIEIGVALQFPAEFVVVRIGQWEGGASAVERV